MRLLAAGLKRYEAAPAPASEQQNSNKKRVSVEQRLPDLDWLIMLPPGMGKGANVLVYSIF